jgi:hypothetical protein
VNPNSLGFSSVLALWASLLLLQGPARGICALLALATLFFSQSRGSMFALAAGLALWIWHLVRTSTTNQRKARDVTFVAILLLALTLGWISLYGGGGQGTGSPVLARFARGVEVLSEGVSADANAQTRVEAWARAIDFYRAHALGTWIEPQFLFGGYIDNDYVRLLLQGSVVFVFAFVLALYGGIRLIHLPSTSGQLAALFAAGVAVNSISATPLMYPPIGAYWLTAGFYLARRTAPGRTPVLRSGSLLQL